MLERGTRAGLRLLRLAAHLLRGLGTIVWRFPRLNVTQRNALVQAWARGLLPRVGVQLQVQGTPPANGPVLLVANHLSWLDIPVLHAARHCRFISKSDVASWPLVSTLARAAGTLFIDRGSRRDTLRIVRLMADALAQRDVLAVFPEGTTSDGGAMLPFRANLLEAAIQADAPVQPLGLRFIDPATGADSAAPIYAGDTTLLASVWRTISAPAIVARVVYGTPQTAQGRDRRAWAQDLQAEVERLRRS
ncbi:lysophospholipid acyltransferase family protein [Comamonas antarctica]|uniref:1-acyl-sn-glycerol-3-phosphate acyltransferase n=1 Tax=Comamonas antarctica TaxID=2743470 RepID=A0A6N1X0X3_9BURK|nr:lysophospholipid acyltransferase family protein [Comamonas antarctica]QKV52003.1 1-acyl-sn-glycerol-3-phosphate acyltransferase [Comamonas antarctica]